MTHASNAPRSFARLPGLVAAAIALASLALPASPAVAQEVDRPPFGVVEGMTGPDFTMMSLAGDPVTLSDLRGRPVLVNFTAAWCITCKVNERVALSTPAVVRAMEAKDIAYLKADWTRHDPRITEELARYQRSGVPLYLLYVPGDAPPEVLPQLLTEGTVMAAFDRL